MKKRVNLSFATLAAMMFGAISEKPVMAKPPYVPRKPSVKTQQAIARRAEIRRDRRKINRHYAMFKSLRNQYEGHPIHKLYPDGL